MFAWLEMLARRPFPLNSTATPAVASWATAKAPSQSRDKGRWHARRSLPSPAPPAATLARRLAAQRGAHPWPLAAWLHCWCGCEVCHRAVRDLPVPLPCVMKRAPPTPTPTPPPHPPTVASPPMRPPFQPTRLLLRRRRHEADVRHQLIRNNRWGATRRQSAACSSMGPV